MRKLLSPGTFLFFSIAFLLVSILVFFHFRGIIYYDEGYILNSALRVAHGQIPYRDFDMVYTPLSYLITGGFFKLFGESVFIERITALVISLLSLFALYNILKLLTKNIFLQILSLLFFISWGPTHTNFTWPVMFAVCFFLYTLLFYLLGILKKNKKYFFIAGAMTIAVFLSKQNFGVGIFCISVLTFLFLKTNYKKTYIISYILGVSSLASAFLIMLLLTSSLLPFIHNMYIYTVQGILVDKALDTPFLYTGSIPERIGKLFFYTLPLILSCISLFVIRENRKLMIVPLSVMVFYLMGIRPTTDYNHLAPLLALVALPVVLIIVSVKNNMIKKITAIFLIGLTLLGFYTAYYKGYYKWDFLLRDHVYVSQNPRVGVYLSSQKAEDIDKLNNYVQEHTKHDDPIFVNVYSPFFYFLTNRNNATRYDFLLSNMPPPAYKLEILDDLKRKNVKLIITHIAGKDEDSVLANYIRNNYRVGKYIGDWVIYIK